MFHQMLNMEKKVETVPAELQFTSKLKWLTFEVKWLVATGSTLVEKKVR